MNRNRYRTIFSKRLGMLVPVAESSRANGKGSGTATERAFEAESNLSAAGHALLLAGAAFCGCAAWASPLPTGGVITAGQGTINQNGTTLTVNQSSQSMSTNWQSFDIGAGNTVVFHQPNSSSVALNRIVGNEASSIFGKLQANGQVFLVNPNGILFAPGSQVSVGGLAASTLNISDADFAAGRYRFTNGTGAGSVVNEGQIDAASVALIGPQVTNNGTIATPGGRTTFAAGDQVTVTLLDGLLSAQVDASVAGAAIVNHGQILADGGRVDLAAGRADSVLTSLINTDGLIQAQGVRQEGGRIFLDGGAGGTVKAGGVLDATAPTGHGGEVHVLGDQVTVAGGARIDASGRDAGGTVLVGGDYQGKNAAILNAHETTVEQGAAIRADGATQGGRVIVWSDGTTRFAGDIHAAGKGFAEVSGKGDLAFSGNVDTGGGTLLLDPTSITVQNSPVGNGTSTFNPGQIKTLLMANDVVLTADAITWNISTTLDYDGIGTRSLTLALTPTTGTQLKYAGVIQDSVPGGDNLNVTFNGGNNGLIGFSAGARILTSGGDIVMRGGTGALTPLPAFTDPGYAAALDSTAAHTFGMGFATLDAGGGNITIRGVGTGANPIGVAFANSRIQTSGSGSITIDGMGATGAVNNGYGIVMVTGAPSITTVDGTVRVQGLARGTGTGNTGMSLTNATIQATGNGNVIINAQSAAGGNASDGILLSNSALKVFNGTMTVAGSATGTGTGSNGIEVTSGGVIASTGSGDIRLDGTTTATGASNNRGVVVSGGTVRTATGALTLQGSSANPAAGAAISLESGGTIGGASQAGAVTLTGDTVNLASGQVSGTGPLLLQPLTPSTSIGVGTGASGTFSLPSGALGLLQDGFSSITIGRADGSGAVDVRTASFTDPVTIRAPASGGSIAVNGTLSSGTGASLGSITLQAGGDLSLNNATIDTSDALTLAGGTYTVTGASILNSNTLAFGNTNGITNTGTLTLNQTADTTIANAIGGAGSLVKGAANTLTLTANNTYGGSTTVNAGTLQVGSGGTSGTLGTGAVTNNGALSFDRSDASTVANTIGGTGNLVQAGTGTTTLAGANTYAGTTTINAGVLRIGADANLGTAPSGATAGQLVLNGGTLETTASFTLDGNRGVTLGASGGTIDVDAGTTLGYGGIVAGPGALAKSDTGTLVLTGNNTYGGTTTVSAGTLQVGNGGTSGTLGTGAVTNNGTLSFNRSDASSVANTIGGTGSLVQAGTGTTILNGNNTYAGTTTVSAGTLQVGNGGTSGTLGTGAVTNNGTLSFDRSDASTVANTIGGTGSLVQAGTGTTVLIGNNTYADTTTVSAGTLQVGNGGTSGTLGTGAVTNNGTLSFNRSDASTVANTIGGTGSLVQAGTGTTVLTGNNAYAGTTTVNAGTLQVGNGGASGTLGTGAVTNNGTLSFNRSDASTVANTIGGTGNLVQAGTGTTTLAGANTYAGTTTISAGVLRISADNNLGTAPTSATAGQLLLNGGTLETTASFTLDANRGVTLGASGGTIDVDAGTTLGYGGVIAGPGALAKSDAGTLVLSGNNTYGGTTTVNAGTLQVGNGGTSGTLGMGAVVDNANLLFNRSGSTSLATLAAGGITGTGDVSVLATGDLDVNRTIALTGPNSRILLQAGLSQPSGAAAGGDVALTSSIGTSATGTVTIFSGDAATAAFEAKISGAAGSTRYKTYNANAADTNGAITGTRNYFYRQAPGTLSVTGLAATKTYDGLIDAMGVLDGSAAVVTPSNDGDRPAYRDLTPLNAAFDNAHAGNRSITASFTMPASIAYSAGGASWSVSGYSGATVTGTGNGTIVPKRVTTSINGVGKTYDGLTSTVSTLDPLSGFVGGDTAGGASGLLLAFDNPNAGTRNIVANGKANFIDFRSRASGNGSGVGTGNEVGGLATDYTITTPASVRAVIAPAGLLVQANNDAKLVTQADIPGYNGVSFTGFMNGDSAASLGGALSITRSNVGTDAAGRYAGVLVPSGYTSANYTITYANGDFRILPAQQLLVRIQNLQNDYGTAAAYVVTSAQYLDADGATLHTLTRTAQNGNTYTYSDNAGGSVAFTVAPQGAIESDAGKLAAGNYALTGVDVNITGGNFVAAHYVGNQAVGRARLTPLATGVTKVYDGTTAMTGMTLDLEGVLAGDTVNVNGSGTFSGRNAGTNLGYTVNALALGGADAGNYYLASGSLSGANGSIAPRPITVTAGVPAGPGNAAGTPSVSGSLAAGDSFARLTQTSVTSNIDGKHTLTPVVQIDDGNGGANYAVTLVDHTAGVVRSGLDIGQLGVIHAISTLNHDNGEGQPERTTDEYLRCNQGTYLKRCGADGDGVYRIVASGLKLPQGLVLQP